MKLLVDSGVATGVASLSHTFEIATDAAFATIVVSKTVPQTTSGQTSVTLDPLPAGTYYWRVRATAGDAAVTSATFTFRILVVLPAPVLVSPVGGELIGSLNQPVRLIVLNPAPAPPVSGVTDTFEVATDGAFTKIVSSLRVLQGAGTQTSLTLDMLTPGTTYYWRVRTAADGAISAVSATASFAIGPGVIAGRYRFVIDGTASACRNPFAVSYSDIFRHQYQFDSDLTQSGQTLVFTKPALPSDFGPDLTLRVSLVGNRVSGGLGGSSTTNNVPEPMRGVPLEVFVSRVQGVIKAVPVDTAGSVNPDGSIDGTFDGYLGVYVPYLDGDQCLATFTWSLSMLTPH